MTHEQAVETIIGHHEAAVKLHARIAELEAEGDRHKKWEYFFEKEAMDRGTQNAALKVHIDRLMAERDTAQAELIRIIVDGEKTHKELKAARAEAAIFRKTLLTIGDEMATINESMYEEIRNDLTAGESHGWSGATNHVLGIVRDALFASNKNEGS